MRFAFFLLLPTSNVESFLLSRLRSLIDETVSELVSSSVFLMRDCPPLEAEQAAPYCPDFPHEPWKRAFSSPKGTASISLSPSSFFSALLPLCMSF